MSGLHELEYADMEYEAEMFDPAPPPAGAVLLTRFAFASSALTATHRRIIAGIAAGMLARIAAQPDWPPLCPVVEISGHEDEPGDPANYGVTGLRRAAAVARALGPRLDEGMKRPPVSAKLPQGIEIQVSSEGPERPIRSNLTADGRAMNRRVEILVHLNPCPTA
jgi:outer membrane protein OmpA-like peptidoglycan-associated protein